MSKFRMMSAALLLAAAVASPAFAAGDEGGGPIGPGSRNGLTPQPGVTHHHALAHHRYGFRRAYNRWNGHYDPEFQRNREDFGFSGRDRSRVGGESPSLHPSAD
jgi:hypothetical protein